MIVGFNHNINYRGTSFHVQTEDSGIKNPHLITLLYSRGTIIASQKVSYADIIKVDNLDKVVEELAKEQHKGILRRLTKGEFDQRIIDFGIPLGGSAGQIDQQQAVRETQSTALPDEEQLTIVEEPTVDKTDQLEVSRELSLDDLIYAYLTAGQKGSSV